MSMIRGGTLLACPIPFSIRIREYFRHFPKTGFGHLSLKLQYATRQEKPLSDAF